MHFAGSPFFKKSILKKWFSHLGVHYPGPRALSSLCAAPSAHPSPGIWGVRPSQGPQPHSPAPLSSVQKSPSVNSLLASEEQFVCFVLVFFKLLICMYFHN